jgi:hypothetical protein
MKSLFAAALAFVVIVTGTQVQAQSRYDRCAAYARDAMTAFYASSAVPVSMAARERGMARSPGIREAGAPAGHNQRSESLQWYFDRCMAR